MGSYAAEKALPTALDLYSRARSYMRSANYEAALISLDEAVSSDPDFTEAHYLRARTLMKLHRVEEAKEALDWAIALNPGDKKLLAGALYTRGTLELETDNAGDALRDLTRALELMPRQAIIYAKRGEAHMKLRMHKEALADFDNAAKLDPVQGNLLENKIEALRKILSR